MAYETKYYDGNYVTCYPGSNQTDNGKLQLEFNMARLVTRVTSKNFCIVQPSFELEVVTGQDNTTQIEIGAGQASINGMDFIINTAIRIAPPTDTGHYIIGMHIQRDEASNVLGDSVYGITRTFEGLYVTFYDEKDETDRDVMYIGEFDWNGTEISNLEEDENKYGRIWGEDILLKIEDPKHPDITRLNLQQWITNVPDWYFSKEGDILYGPLEITDGREGSGEVGIKLEVEDEYTSTVTIKAPTTISSDTNKVMRIKGTTTGTEINMGRAKVSVDSTDNYVYNIYNPEDIKIHSNKDVKIQGDTGVEIGGGLNSNQPKLVLENHTAVLTDSNSQDLIHKIEFIDNNNMQQTIGKAIWQYNNTNRAISLLQTNVDYLDIVPDTDFNNDIRIQDTIYIGDSNIYGNELTYLKKAQWRLGSSANVYTNMTPSIINAVNNTNESGYIRAGMTEDDSALNSASSKIYNNGTIELLNKNSNTETKLAFKDGTPSVDTSITKTNGQSKLNYNASTHTFNGNIDATGYTITADKVYNAVYNDIVEFVEKEDYAEVIEAGDVVYFNDSGKVSKYHQGINPNAIAGIVSSEETYGYALGGDGLEDNQKVPVALKGRVWVKTDNTGYKAGDFVSVDACGCVYKGDYHIYDNYVLGIATKPEDDGKVLVWIR